jgi:hypothetical protein
MPFYDVLVSPEHAIFVDGVLIPAKFLVNGDTIAQVRRRIPITYYHIELARHAIVLAAGLPAETYLDTGNRDCFANGGPVVRQHPDFSERVWEAEGCAPIVVTGPVLKAVRRRLRRRATALARGYAVSRRVA